MAQQDQQQPKKTFAPPVSIGEMFPTEHIKCADLRGQSRTYTIKQVVKQEVEGDKGIKVRGVIKFQETDQSLVMNRTNATLLMTMFGANPQEWAGKKVTLDPSTTKFGPETVECIRIGGSPDIDRDMRAAVKLPKRSPVNYTLRCTRQYAPTLADFESCKELAEFEGLDRRRIEYWKKIPTAHKEPIKAAALACKERLESEAEQAAKQAAAAQQEAQAEQQADATGEDEPFDAEKALADLTTPADRDALEATWSDVVDHFDAMGQEIPVPYDAAYQLSKEQFAE
jgi:hypothetical protein